MDDILDDDLDGLLSGPAAAHAPAAASPAAAAGPAPAPAARPAPAMRAVSDPRAVREAIYARTLAGFRALEPIANKRYSLSLHDVDYADPGEFSAAERKRAILEGRTLSRRLRGTWRLADAVTGEEVARRTSTLARVPHYTDKGTFVLNGSDWTLAAQKRLLPGVYNRRRENGELESHVNVMPGKGLSHRIQLDPASGVFSIRAGGSVFPLMPVLKALGTSDDDLRAAWGDLVQANAAASDPRAVRKFHDKVVRAVRPDDDRTPEARLREALEAMPLDPEVNRSTLGEGFDRVTPAAYLAATRRLIGINRGEQEPDDRDHLAFMRVLGQEDLISERVAKDLGPLRKALWKATMKQGDLSGLPTGLFTDALLAAIQRSGLGQPSESVNPGQWLEQMGRVSRMGVGGIADTDAIPAESKSVQPSHLGYIDALATPENSRAGVDARFASPIMKGDDGRIYAKFRNLRSGEEELVSPDRLVDATIAFPNELRDLDRSHVNAMRKGRMMQVPRGEVDYAFERMEDAFSPLANLVPMKSGIKGQRAAMGMRMSSQALPLVGAEAPLVQNMRPDADESYERAYGTAMGAVRADADAWVRDVTDDGIVLRMGDGSERTIELTRHEPTNRKTGYHQTAAVRPGQAVRKGDLLARSNYTDAEGTTALGRNVRVALVPGFGSHSNYEDAWVISKGAAEKFKSEHYYQHSVEDEDGLRIGRRDFLAAFPAKYPRKVLDNFTDDGVIKPGTRVSHGDPLVLAVKKRSDDGSKVYRGRGPSLVDSAETWDHHSEGVVTDVVRTKDGAKVVVRTEVPAEIGDKLSNRFGGKGVISSIVPDDEMPRDEQGNVVDLLFNPAGVITRGNPSAALEVALGKIASMTGNPYKIRDFDKIQDLAGFVQDELKKHGVSDEGELTDPRTGRKIPGVMTGSAFFMKLHHMSADKNQGRGMGGYTADHQPAKAGDNAAKRLALMSLNALLSSGASEVIKDALHVRGQANPDYWARFMSGNTPSIPEVPFVHRKFVEQMKASGINVTREGSRFKIHALRGQDVGELAGGRVLKNAETADYREGLRPVKGGLFDEALTGGHGGNRWSAIELAEPIVSPVFEDPARRLLGLTEQGFRDVIAGKERFRGRTGPGAIATALRSMDLKGEIEKARVEIAGNRKTARDAAIKRLKYLKSAEKDGIHPGDWVWDKVPVLPPIFRPVSVSKATGRPLIADPNVLYGELFEADKLLRSMRGKVEDLGQERLAVYDAVKAVAGLDDPIHPKTAAKGVRGLLKEVMGSSPKYGTVQRKLLSAPVDLVGRSVIVPDPDLDLDSVGVPETHAWEVYKPFIVRRLVRRGASFMDASRAVRDRTEAARGAMVAEMDERPVILDRAPVLHRYGVLAFRPRLVKGDAIRMSPLVTSGFGADFDGDQMNYQVPSGESAVREAFEKLLPSRNLISPANFKVHQLPSREYAAGLWLATKARPADSRPRTFASAEDAVKAYRRGEIDADQDVEIARP